MKLLHLVLLFTLLLAQKSFSQSKVKFHLSIGPTISVPKTSKLADTNLKGAPLLKSSVNIGGYLLPEVRYQLTEKASVESGIGLYVDRFAIDYSEGITTLKNNRTVSQLQIPVSLNHHFGNNNSFSIGGGALTALLISAVEKGTAVANYSTLALEDIDLPQSKVQSEYSESIKDRYNLISFGAFVQVRKEVVLSRSFNGYIILRANQYINSIKNTASTESTNTIKSKNEKESTTINVGFGIIL